MAGMIRAPIFLFIVAILLFGLGSPSFSTAIEDHLSSFTRGNSGLVLAQEDDDEDDPPEGKEEWCVATGSTNPICQDSEKQQQPPSPTVNAPAPALPSPTVQAPAAPPINLPELREMTIPMPGTGVVQ